MSWSPEDDEKEPARTYYRNSNSCCNCEMCSTPDPDTTELDPEDYQ